MSNHYAEACERRGQNTWHISTPYPQQAVEHALLTT
jgi:hypothetical protein